MKKLLNFSVIFLLLFNRASFIYASTCAPALTATISAGVSTAVVPVAFAAGAVCATVAVGEVAQLGYFYATDQMVEFYDETDRIKQFASNFYDFDQTSYQHVENVAQGVTTVAWSSCKETIMNTLQGLQNVHFDAYMQGKKIIQKSFTATKEAIARARELIDSPELSRFNGSYKQIFGESFFTIKAEEQIALAGITESINANEISSLIPVTQHLLTEPSSTTGEKIVTTVVSQTVKKNIENQSVEIVDASLVIPVNMDLFHNPPMIYQNRYEKFMQADFIVPGIEQFKDIRQLADLSIKTKNFTDVSSLTKAEIYYVNKIHYAQQASNYTKLFIDQVQPKVIFVDPEMNIAITYPIKGIAFNHIHIGEYGGKTGPTGCHCMPEFLANETFKPIFLKDGPCGSKYIRIYDPVKEGKYKDTSIYPIDWSHEKCDMKMFEALSSDRLTVDISEKRKNILDLIGFTQEGMEIHAHYNIDTGIITSHYPFIEINEEAL